MELEELRVPIIAEVDKWVDSLKSITDSTDSCIADLSTSFSDIGGYITEVGTITVSAVSAMVAGVAVAIAGLGASIKDLLLSSSELASRYSDLSQKVGISTEKLQELNFIGNASGVSLDTITGSITRMNKSLIENKDSFDQLGISIVDANGEYLDTEEIFFSTLQALSKVENQTLRDALSMEIFGKSATDLNGIMNLSSEEYQELAEQAGKLGAVVSEEDISNLEAWGDKIGMIGDGFEGLKAKLATVFLPLGDSVVNQILSYMEDINAIIEASNGDSIKLLSDLLTYLTNLLLGWVSELPSILEQFGEIFTQISAVLLANLPTILDAFAGILESVINFIITALPMFLEIGLRLLETIVNSIVTNLPILVEAAVKILVQLMETLTESMPILIPAIVEAVILISNTLIENLPILIEAGLQLLLAIIEGINSQIPVLKNAVPQLVTAFIDALVILFPIILDIGGQILANLIAGIMLQVTALIELSGQLIEFIKQGLSDGFSGIIEAGENIVLGLWNGIENKLSWLKDKINSFSSGIVSTFNTLFGIQSPSTVMMEVGDYLAQGLVIGLTDGISGLDGILSTSLKNLLKVDQNVTINNFTTTNDASTITMLRYLVAKGSL